MGFNFLQFLTEKYALDDCDYLVQAKTIDADPHEILTAFLCLDTYYNKYLSNSQSQSGNKLSQSGNELLETIKNIITDIGNCTEIIAGNDFKNLFSNLHDELDKNKLSDKNIEFYQNIKDALPQAASAAIAIKSNFAKPISKVYLTGSSWPTEVPDFTVSKHGMKDYNSSDIIVTDGRRYLGVSLKKKDKETDPDPTIINKSLFNLKVNEIPLKDISGKDETKLKDMFDTWFADQIISASKYFTPEFIKVNCTKDAKNKNALLKFFNKETLAKVNKDILSKFNHKKLTNAGKTYFRNLINRELSGVNSIFNKLKKFLEDNHKLTDDLANQLVDLIFKPDLIKLLNDTNPDLPKFDFALCTGKGKTSKPNNDNLISFKIDEADYYPITTISNVITSLKDNSNKATFIICNKDKTSNAAKIFLNLKIGEIVVANLEIRYKGTYSPSPQFLGNISDEFKKLLKVK